MEHTVKNIIENATKSFHTLSYIVESNSKIIKEISVRDVTYEDRWGQFECYFELSTHCEDPDIGLFSHEIDKCDTELYNIIKDYEFKVNGTLVKSNDRYLQMLFIGCNWNLDNDTKVTLIYHIIQDEFNS
jgi:hypothetical protein